MWTKIKTICLLRECHRLRLEVTPFLHHSHAFQFLERISGIVPLPTNKQRWRSVIVDSVGAEMMYDNYHTSNYLNISARAWPFPLREECDVKRHYHSTCSDVPAEGKAHIPRPRRKEEWRGEGPSLDITTMFPPEFTYVFPLSVLMQEVANA